MTMFKKLEKLLTILAIAYGLCAQIVVAAEEGTASQRSVLIDLEHSPVELHRIPIEVSQVSDRVYVASGITKLYLIATTEGNVLFDAGFSGQASKQLTLLQEAVPGKIVKVVVSHSHPDHTGAAIALQQQGAEIIAHREFVEEQRYLNELADYQHRRNQPLFPWMPEELPDRGPFPHGRLIPSHTVGEQDYIFELGGVRFEVLSAPGAEGADNIVLWLPDQKMLFSGDTFGPFFPAFPNVFTMRGEKVRKPVEYIQSLDKMIPLGAQMILPAHPPIVSSGGDEITAGLIRMRDAVQYVHDRVIDGMNSGKTVYQLMAEVVLPTELELSQQHGRVSWAVKSIWEYYATWFHFDTTTELYAVSPRAVYGDVGSLVGSDVLTRQAEEYLRRGEAVKAIQVLEMANAADDSYAPAWQSHRRALKVLLERAENGLANNYEIYWLRLQIRRIDEKLKVLVGP